jgi:hypothetical protein
MAQPNVRLKRIDIARAKAENGKAAIVKTAATKNGFVVNVDFTIAGSYTQSKQSAEQLVLRLAELGALEGTRFDHVRDQSRPGEPMATFSTSIVLKTTAFQ